MRLFHYYFDLWGDNIRSPTTYILSMAFQCHYCPKSFTRRYNLNSHIKLCHPNQLHNGLSSRSTTNEASFRGIEKSSVSTRALLPRPKTLFLERYYFHRRVSVCLCGCISIISKSSWPISMKFGRMMYNDIISVPFEDEINRVDRTQTSPKRVVKIDIKETYL